ncbi:MAG: hypothetical protein H0U44_12265 [Flavisolibacter sp.]|nr:hypothetical protein [Flavisolibacter sp.]
MKKFLSLLVLLATLQAQAQLKGFSVGPYAERAWTTGDLQSKYENGFGAGIGADIKLPGKLGLTGSMGILRFGGKNIEHQGVNEKVKALMATPLRVGIKYRLPIVYLKLESGTVKLNDGNGSALILSPGAGIRIFGLDVQAKYETWIRSNPYSFYGIRAAYNF